jgi:NitT/TauT family transport system ATP-binding protein
MKRSGDVSEFEEIRMLSNFVELDRVSLRYGDEDGTLALHGTSLAVERGEFVAIVGPSGCGKSSLMKVVTGLWPPSSGSVKVDGKTVNAPLSCVGMAFQNPTLLPWRSTLANVMLPLEIVKPHSSRLFRNRAEYETKARELLHLVGLEGFDHSLPWQLSGGMQQRAQLCRALIHEPLLLMLDEPFGALDMFTREELWVTLQDLWMARRPTVILVTHDLREAAFLADRVLVMSTRPGRVVAERKIDHPRPRTPTSMFSAESGAIIQELRGRIGASRTAL